MILHEECLNFINFGLNKFEKDKSIGSISGFSYLHKFEKDNYQNWFKLYRHCSWSWGTWRTVWNKINWNIESLSLNKLEKGLKKKIFESWKRYSPSFICSTKQNYKFMGCEI